MDDRFPLALPDNTVLAGQYIIQSTLGQGGFGITYKALDRMTGKNVAIKEYFPDSMATRTPGQTVVMTFSGERRDNFEYGKQCFLQEAETLAKFIGIDNIVRIYSYFEEFGTAYFVMDYIEGTSLDEFIKQHGGKLSFDESVNILIPVMDALSVVHEKGIVHRDVSPDNIYITTDGSVKLIDFGAARQSLGDKSQSLDVILKHGFAPKEQYTRRGKQGPYTDIYALGATFYYTLTGKKPPDSLERLDDDEIIPPSALGVKLPREAEEAILMALNVQPDERFQSMTAFKNAMLSVKSEGVSDTVKLDELLTDNASSAVRKMEESISVEKSQIEDSSNVKTSMPEKKMFPTKGIIIFAAAVIFCIALIKIITGMQFGKAGIKIIGNNVNNLTARLHIDVNASEPGTFYKGNAGGEAGVNADAKNMYSCISIIGDEGYALDGLGKAVKFSYNEDGISNATEIPELSNFTDIARLLVSEDFYYIYTIGGDSHVYSVDRKNGTVAESRLSEPRAKDITFTEGGKFCYIDWNGETGLISLYVTSAQAIDDTPELYYTIPDKYSGITDHHVFCGDGEIVYVYLWTGGGLNNIYKFDLSNDKDREPKVLSVPDSTMLYETNCDGTTIFYAKEDETSGKNIVGSLDFDTGEWNSLYESSINLYELTVYPDRKGIVSFFEGNNNVVTVP